MEVWCDHMERPGAAESTGRDSAKTDGKTEVICKTVTPATFFFFAHGGFVYLTGPALL